MSDSWASTCSRPVRIAASSALVTAVLMRPVASGRSMLMRVECFASRTANLSLSILILTSTTLKAWCLRPVDSMWTLPDRPLPPRKTSA